MYSDDLEKKKTELNFQRLIDQFDIREDCEEMV